MAINSLRITSTSELLALLPAIEVESLVVDANGNGWCRLQIQHDSSAIATIEPGAWKSPDVPKSYRRILSALEKISQVRVSPVEEAV
jgi:hypothetical protein